MRKIVFVVFFFCLFILSEAKPHIYMKDSSIPLYSEMSESAKFKRGVCKEPQKLLAFYHEMHIGKEQIDVKDDDISIKISSNKKWVELSFKENNKPYTFYAPAKCFTIEYYEDPVRSHPKTDPFNATYKLLEDKSLMSESEKDVCIGKIPSGEIVVVNKLFDDGHALCLYGTWGIITSSNIVPTTEQYEEGEIVGVDENSYIVKNRITLSMRFFLENLRDVCICVLPFIVLAVLCGWVYRRKLFAGRRIKILDFLGGLFVCAAIVSSYVYYASNYNIMDEIIDWLPQLESGFWEIVMLSVYINVLYLIWWCIIRLFIKVGPNWMYYVITIAFFALLSLGAFVRVVDGYGLWGFAAFVAIPLSAFIGFCIFFNFMKSKRCPRCHSAGSRNVNVISTDDLGYTTEYSNEYKHRTEHDSESDCNEYKETTRYIKEKYNVEKHKRNFRDHMRCCRCGEEWYADYSFTVGTNKRLDSVENDTHTTTYKW